MPMTTHAAAALAALPDTRLVGSLQDRLAVWLRRGTPP